jgi:hypothetical protein
MHYLVTNTQGNRCCSVIADNPRQAKADALKHPNFKDWVLAHKVRGTNPFKTLKVYPTECHHGCCYCEYCKGYCERCQIEKEWENGGRWHVTSPRLM